MTTYDVFYRNDPTFSDVPVWRRMSASTRGDEALTKDIILNEFHGKKVKFTHVGTITVRPEEVGPFGNGQPLDVVFHHFQAEFMTNERLARIRRLGQKTGLHTSMSVGDVVNDRVGRRMYQCTAFGWKPVENRYGGL